MISWELNEFKIAELHAALVVRLHIPYLIHLHSLLLIDMFTIEGTSSTTEHDLSLQQMTQYWRDRLPFPLTAKLPSPLNDSTLLKPNDQYNDYAHVAWQGLLGGGDSNIPKLRVVQSETEFLRSLPSPNIQIERRWDVDSFMARPTSLAAHRGGFYLSYRPSYMRRVTQNPCVSFNDHAIHKLKNLQLGQGALAAGLNYNTHVFFSHMPIGHDRSTHLTDELQELWIDQIVLPALQSSCSNDVIHHHPRSFADVKCKADVQKEVYDTRAAGINLRYLVPDSCLADFWNEVVRLASTVVNASGADRVEFKAPFLVISGHDLKLHFKRDTANRTRVDFQKSLQLCFRWSSDMFPPKDCWLDFGMEDTPRSSSHHPAITLLRKTTCLHDWVKRFHCSAATKSGRMNTQSFHWSLTQDCGSATVELLPENSLRRQNGIALNKAYNVHKNLFTTPYKGYQPFQNPQFEALGYSTEHISRWYTINNRNVADNLHVNKRKQLINAYQRSKSRVATALDTTKETNFGVRQEYRINWFTFITLDLDDKLHVENVTEFSAENLNPSASRDSSVSIHSDSGRLESNFHRPYFVLPTKEVNRYVAEDINRWLFCLEVLVMQADPSPSTSISESQEIQLQNGIMISAILRTLRLIMGGLEPFSMSGLWLKSWTSKRRKLRAGAALNARSFQPLRLGLNYRSSLERYGLAWLPNRLMNWTGTPRFTPEAQQHLALTRNAFQITFHRARNIQDLVNRENEFDKLFIEMMQERLNHIADSKAHQQSLNFALISAASLIIQCYIQDVFALLATRVPSPRNLPQSRRHAATELTNFTSSLTANEAAGLAGLSYPMVERLLNLPPRLVEPRASKKGLQDGGLRRYHTGLWPDKLTGLFAWDNVESLDKPIHRNWQRTSFRTLTRKLAFIISNELGAEGHAIFLQKITSLAAAKLWIIPHYDSQRLSIMYTKGSTHRDINTQEIVQTLTPLQRTQWLMPQMHSSYHRTLRQAEFGLGLTELTDAEAQCLLDDEENSDDLIEEAWPEKIEAAQLLIAEALETDILQQSNEMNYSLIHLPKLPEMLGFDLTLPFAAAFQEKSDQRMQALKDAHDDTREESPSI